MTEKQYNTFCDDMGIPDTFREENRADIENLTSYQTYAVHLELIALHNAIINAIPKWIKRFRRCKELENTDNRGNVESVKKYGIDLTNKEQ